MIHCQQARTVEEVKILRGSGQPVKQHLANNKFKENAYNKQTNKIFKENNIAVGQLAL
jgi:hypothetical protein